MLYDKSFPFLISIPRCHDYIPSRHHCLQRKSFPSKPTRVTCVSLSSTRERWSPLAWKKERRPGVPPWSTPKDIPSRRRRVLEDGVSGSLLWDSIVLASLAGHFVIRLHGFMLVCTWVYVCIYVYAMTFFYAERLFILLLLTFFFFRVTYYVNQHQCSRFAGTT